MDACPDFSADDPLVRSLLGVTDCHVQSIVQGGYARLFQAGGALGPLLTAGLTVYVALIGYQLLLGRTPLRIGDAALSAVKLGAVLALATQWGAYQRLVYDLLFQGPAQLAAIIGASGAAGSAAGGGGDVFDGLQRAFTDLTAFSPATPPGAPAPGAPGAGQLSTLLSRAGFDSLLLLGSAVVLLASTLGVLLASKIVLGFLLALGPLFIALMLFEPTFGLFEGWLRAAIGFALAPLGVILTLALSLTLLEPSLQQLEAMRASSSYLPGVAFGVFVLVLVSAAVCAGLLLAGAIIALGLRIRPGARVAAVAPAPALQLAHARIEVGQGRAARTAAAVVSRTRATSLAASRTFVSASTPAPAEGAARPTPARIVEPRPGAPWAEQRLGQSARRARGPRGARAGGQDQGRRGA